MWKVTEIQVTVSIRNPQPSLGGLVAFALETENGSRYGTRGTEDGYPVFWGSSADAQKKADTLNKMDL